jgi:hypothetical protein
MIVTRRGFLQGCFAVGIAPMLGIVSKGSGIIVPSRRLIVTESIVVRLSYNPITERFVRCVATRMSLNVHEPAKVEFKVQKSKDGINWT